MGRPPNKTTRPKPIDLRNDKTSKKLYDIIEPITLSSLLKENSMTNINVPQRSWTNSDKTPMRSMPHSDFLQIHSGSYRSCGSGSPKSSMNLRKVRFAMFDKVHFCEPSPYEYDKDYQQRVQRDVWWTREELENNRRIEAHNSLIDRKVQRYIQAYTDGFREISKNKNVSTGTKQILARGGASGFRGLEASIISKEWNCTSQLDKRCIIASTVKMYDKLLQENKHLPRMHVSTLIASHSKMLTKSHRLWSVTLGEVDYNAVSITSM